MIARVGLPTAFLLILVTVCLLPCHAQGADDTFSGAVDAYFSAVEAYDSGKSDEAVRGLRQALKTFQHDQSAKGEFMVYLSLAQVMASQGDYDRAMSELNKALQAKQRSRDIIGEAVVRLRMADIEIDRARFGEARKLIESALAGAKAMEEDQLAAIALYDQSRIMIVNGKLHEARKILEDSLPKFRTAGDYYHLASVLTLLAQIATIRNDYPAAWELLTKSEELAAKGKFNVLQHKIHAQQAYVLRDQGRLAEARAKLTKALEFFEKAGRRRQAGSMRTVMADILLREGRQEEALNTARQASDELRRLDAAYDSAWNSAVQGRILLQSARLTDAMKSLEKAVEVFTEKQAPLGKLSAKLALARVQLAQGRLIAASINAENAAKAASALKTPLGEAHVAFVLGLIEAASGGYTAAIGQFGKAIERYRVLKDDLREAMSRIRRGEALVAAGYPDAAGRDVEVVNKLPASKEEVVVRGNLFLLKAAIARSEGDVATADGEFEKAQAILGAIEDPMIQASLLRWKTEGAMADRSYYRALESLDTAEKLFDRIESPGRTLACREAQVRIALDRNNLREAQTIVRKSLRLPWARGYGSRKKDHDTSVLEARQACLRAQVKLAAGDANGAARDAEKALGTALELNNRTLSQLTAKLMGRILMAQKKYGNAIDQFRSLHSPSPWRVGHAQAMSLVSQDKRKEAVPVFEKAIADLEAQELGEGLTHMAAVELREREDVYGDCIDCLMALGQNRESAEFINKAWTVGERLKMRRFAHLRAAVGAVAVPGVPNAEMEKLRRLQAEAVNRLKRREHPGVSAQVKGANPKDSEKADRSPYSDVKRFVEESAGKYGHLSALMLASAPSSRDVAARLKSRERYVTIIATRERYHAFLVGKQGVKAGKTSAEASRVDRMADAIAKGLSSPYYYKIDRRANELWAALFGGFDSGIESADRLIIETDGLLTTFPFEVLTPGSFPDAYQDQQTMPFVFEKLAVSRTTSAFRFLGKRTDTKSSSPLIAFIGPEIPKDASNGLSEGARLLAKWKRVLSGFDSALESEGVSQFDKNAQVFSEARATRSAFLNTQSAQTPIVHLACPVLAPGTPAGSLSQPFLVFSQEDNDPRSAFCGVTDLSVSKRPAAGMVCVWLGRDGAAADGIFLLLESLNLSGVGWVMAPQWETDRQGETNTIAMLHEFYKALREGHSPATALHRARATLRLDSSRKNRCNPARMALY